jgi:hypothetical protein
MMSQSDAEGGLDQHALAVGTTVPKDARGTCERINETQHPSGIDQSGEPAHRQSDSVTVASIVVDRTGSIS